MLLRDFCPVELPPGLKLPDEILIGPGVGSSLPEVSRRHLEGSGLVVGDPATLAAVDGVVASDLDEKLVLPDHPHADDANVDEVLRRARDGGHRSLVAVGSGTVNDVCKMAAEKAGLPFVVLGTAASMNGYASGIAAILSGGLKTTVPARPARVVILDSEILAAAPLELAQAGLGDLLSKPVSMADWWLGHVLEGARFDQLPGRIVDVAIEEAARNAPGIATRELPAFEALARALVLSGVSMVAAGSSSPASGGEHLLSHLWDMESLVRGEPVRLHGAHVGVATTISAALYHALLELAAPTLPADPSWADEETRVRREHPELAETVVPQAKAKHARRAERSVELASDWPKIREGLAALSIPKPEEIRATLDAAGAPSTLDALGISRDSARSVLLRARDIRDRFTVLDLAFELGYFPGGVDEVLDRVESSSQRSSS